ncbi:MAG TPA: ATP-binding protein [Actinomycetota bacterium]|nr:ATP-binding protein [Actinomycetota bacterium]
MTDLPPVVSAEVPATPGSVQVLRNVAAGVAARLDMPIDQIEEIRLAVTEAASLLLDEAEATMLQMTIGRDEAILAVTLSSDGKVDPWPSDRALASWPWLVVKGLTDEIRADRRDGDGPSIRFTKRHERVHR